MTTYPLEVRIATPNETSMGRERRIIDASMQTEATMLPLEPSELPKLRYVAQCDDGAKRKPSFHYLNIRCQPDVTYDYANLRLEDDMGEWRNVN